MINNRKQKNKFNNKIFKKLIIKTFKQMNNNK